MSESGRTDCKWMYGDVNPFAWVNPARWSGSLSFDACSAQLEEQKAKMDRPIVIKAPSGILSKEQRFDDCQTAIQWLKDNDPERKSSTEKEGPLCLEAAIGAAGENAYRRWQGRHVVGGVDSLWNGMTNLVTQGFANDIDWYCVVCAAQLTFNDNALDFDLQYGELGDLLKHDMNRKITACTEYRRYFTGYYHSFTVLDLEGCDKQISIEKWKNQLECIIGYGKAFRKFVHRFRVTGQTRNQPTGCLQHANSPQARCELSENVTVADFVYWTSGPLAKVFEPFSFMVSDAASFAADLRLFLTGSETVQMSLEKVRGQKQIVLQAVQRDGLLLQYATSSLLRDPEIATAALTQNSNAVKDIDNAMKRGIVIDALVDVVKQGNGIVAHAVAKALEDGALVGHACFEDRLFMLEVLNQNGMLLQHTSDPLKGDREVVCKAFKQASDSNQYAVPALRRELTILIAGRQFYDGVTVFLPRFDSDASGVNLAYTSSLNADTWKFQVYCSEVTLTQQGSSFSVHVAQSSLIHLQSKYCTHRIERLTLHKHSFPNHTDSEILEIMRLGMFHAYTLLEFDNGALYMCVEKLGDRLHCMVGHGDCFHIYAKLFLATGEERMGNWNGDESGQYLERPIRAEPTQTLHSGVPFSHLASWLDRKAQEPYSLIGSNCQDFAKDLENELRYMGMPSREVELQWMFADAEGIIGGKAMARKDPLGRFWSCPLLPDSLAENIEEYILRHPDANRRPILIKDAKGQQGTNMEFRMPSDAVHWLKKDVTRLLADPLGQPDMCVGTLGL